MDNKIDLATQLLKLTTKAMVDLGAYPDWYYSSKSKIDTSSLIGQSEVALQNMVEELQLQGKLPTNQVQLKKVIQNLREMMAGIENEVGNITEMAANQAVKETTHQIAKRSIDLKTFSIPEKAIEKLKEQSVEFSQDTIDKIVDDYKGALEEGMREGVGVDQMAAKLRERKDKIADPSLERLARTETHSARQSAKQETHMVNAVTFKQWWTAEDDRVRDGMNSEFDHTEMHGQITYTSKEFTHPTEGWSLMYPGERFGAYDLANIINCRCTSIPFVPPEGTEQNLKNLIEQNGYAYPDELVVDDTGPNLSEDAEFDTLDEWKDNLSPDELDSIGFFTGTGYHSIRDLQRGVRVDRWSEDRIKNISDKVNNINDALEKAPKYKGTTYRGMRGLNPEAFDKFTGEVGEKIQFEAISSTSTEESIARNFSGYDRDTDLMLEIDGHSGVDIKNVSRFEGEEELLFREKATFEITGEHTDEKLGCRVIECKEVEPNA